MALWDRFKDSAQTMQTQLLAKAGRAAHHE
jgi:hypothetical protein